MIAGDICPPRGRIPEAQLPWLECIFAPWVESLGKPVYLTLGNHDFCNYFKGPPNLRYGTESIIDDVLLFSWTPKLDNWAWEAEEDVLDEKLEALLAAGQTPSVWLTHSPPWGICDGWGDAPDLHNGSHALRAAVEKYQPRLVICGHIHAGAGIGKLGQTKIYNVSILDGDRGWFGQPVRIAI
jgi:3',5'-cyclic AMP phosphodiesterase CpdA